MNLQRKPVLWVIALAAVLLLAFALMHFSTVPEIDKPLLQRKIGYVNSESPDIVAVREKFKKQNLSKAQPILPIGNNQQDWPSTDALAGYLLQLGKSIVVDDSTARWLMRLVREHPDVALRPSFLAWAGHCFSRGRAGEVLASDVSDSVKDEVVTFLIETGTSATYEMRSATLSAIATSRLHLQYPPLLDVAKDIYDHRNNMSLSADKVRHIEKLWEGIQISLKTGK